MAEDEISALIKEAGARQMSADQLREQRISFAYGNTHFENETITREMVASEAERLEAGRPRD